MKALIISLTILCSVILTTALVACYTNRIMSELENTVNEKITNDFAASSLGAEDIESKYDEIKPFLTLFMCDSEVREMEMYIADIKSAARNTDEDGLREAKSRLMLHIGQIKRLSAFSIEAIF